MKIRLVGAELFHTDGRMDGWTDRRDEGNESLFAMMRTRLKTRKRFSIIFDHR
jgi:hypothetical protein